MHGRMDIIFLIDILRKNPPKSSIDFIQHTKKILWIFQQNPEGNTFLRLPYDAPIIDQIKRYLQPFIQPLNLKVYYTPHALLHISNIKDLTFMQLDKIMAEEAHKKASQSYKTIIEALAFKNEYLTILLHQKKTLENSPRICWHQPDSGKDFSSPMDLSESELPVTPEEKKHTPVEKENLRPKANEPPKLVQTPTNEEYDNIDKLEIKQTLTVR